MSNTNESEINEHNCNNYVTQSNSVEEEKYDNSNAIIDIHSEREHKIDEEEIQKDTDLVNSIVSVAQTTNNEIETNKDTNSPTDCKYNDNLKEIYPILSKNVLLELNDVEVIDHMIQMNQLFALYIRSMLRSSLRKEATARRCLEHRIKWDNYSGNMPEDIFRRNFRMEKRCFIALRETIINAVGHRTFKLQEYLELLEKLSTNEGVIYRAHKVSCGGYVCGEVKLAMVLRMLAGASYLDISEIFHIKRFEVYPILREVINNWICNDLVINIDWEAYFSNKQEMKRNANEFVKSSHGTFKNCVGALDGWLVKITKPVYDKDTMPSPPSYYSRKGYYALNVQVIVNKRRKKL